MGFHRFVSLSFLLALAFGSFLIFMGLRPKPAKKITKSELGRMLFFDPILSADSSVSCGSCHIPSLFFADSAATSQGIGGKRTKRNTPSVLNMANRDRLFWDGRAGNLRQQVLFPIRDPNEMNLPIPLAIKRLQKSKVYKTYFHLLFQKRPDEKSLAEVIAAYEETLETGNSRFDRYMAGKETFSEDEKAGHQLFVGKAKCFDCHFSPDFTGDEFKNIGLYNGKDWNDPGRFAITKRKEDLGKFKVPGLRNVAYTAPYMHNGRLKTLREVIDFYASPDIVVQDAIGTDPSIKGGISLTEREKNQLEAFLLTLTSDIRPN